MGASPAAAADSWSGTSPRRLRSADRSRWCVMATSSRSTRRRARSALTFRPRNWSVAGLHGAPRSRTLAGACWPSTPAPSAAPRSAPSRTARVEAARLTPRVRRMASFPRRRTAVKTMSEAYEIVEVGPRDGLQSESEIMPTETKVELIRRLVAAGVRRLEVASFVNPKRVPQMADAEAVLAALPKRADLQYIGLVLNRRGFDRALAAGCGEIGMVVPVTDSFTQRNQGM